MARQEYINALKSYNFQISLFLMSHPFLQKSLVYLSYTFLLLLHMRKYIMQHHSSRQKKEKLTWPQIDTNWKQKNRVLKQNLITQFWCWLLVLARVWEEESKIIWFFKYIKMCALKFQSINIRTLEMDVLHKAPLSSWKWYLAISQCNLCWYRYPLRKQKRAGPWVRFYPKVNTIIIKPILNKNQSFLPFHL